MKAPAARPRADLRDSVPAGDLEVDRAPVTNERYVRFVEATGHRPPLYWADGTLPPALAQHPVVGVDLFDALAFADWAGGRLPTELEWVQATGLTEHRAYVWGDDFRSSACNTVRDGRQGTSRVGAYPDGQAPNGCVDLCGNVWELTCSAHPEHPDTVLVKGGSWHDFPCHAKIDASFRARVDHAGATVGFRLVYGGPLRLPTFLTPERLAQAIARRRGTRPRAQPPRDELATSGDLLRVTESAPIQRQGTRQAPTILDQRTIDSSPVPATVQVRVAPVRETALDGRVGRIARFLPIAAILAVVALTLVVVLTLIEEPDPRRGDRRVEIAIAPPPAPTREALSSVPRSPLEQAIEDLGSDDAEMRTKAESYLLDHAEQATIALDRLVLTSLPRRARASVRYLKAALQEFELGANAEPLIVKSPPAQGLVHVVDSWTADQADQFAHIRRTGTGEGLPVTLVYTGTEPVDLLLAHHSYEMGAVIFFHDERDTLARRWGIRHKPATAGLDATGRLTFLHVGSLKRASLADRADKLRSQ